MNREGYAGHPADRGSLVAETADDTATSFDPATLRLRHAVDSNFLDKREDVTPFFMESTEVQVPLLVGT